MDTILKRIQKLLALTVERGATPEEAATAAAKAQALLFEHNLSMAQVEAVGDIGGDEIFDYVLDIAAAMRFVNWRKALISAIAEYNFCTTIRLDAKRISIGSHWQSNSHSGEPSGEAVFRWLKCWSGGLSQCVLLWRRRYYSHQAV
jgi:hypothetical protein